MLRLRLPSISVEFMDPRARTEPKPTNERMNIFIMLDLEKANRTESRRNDCWRFQGEKRKSILHTQAWLSRETKPLERKVLYPLRWVLLLNAITGIMGTNSIYSISEQMHFAFYTVHRKVPDKYQSWKQILIGFLFRYNCSWHWKFLCTW